MLSGRNAEMLSGDLRRVAYSLGYRRLLPVQEEAIPYVMRGDDVLIVAPTGSGKTEAVLFPVLSMMMSRRSEGLQVVYVTPLRALNRDILVRVRRLVEGCGFRVSVRHGDTGPRDRRSFLEDPPDMVITTPETLTLLLTVRRYSGLWRSVRWLVVDEVHEMIEGKRGVELAVTIERLQRRARGRIQRIGLSATLSRRSLEEASRLISPRGRVSVVMPGVGKRYSVEVRVVEGGDWWERAVEAVAGIIRGARGSVLVFTNTRSTAEALGLELSRILGEDAVAVHHSSLSRRVREEAEERFRSGGAKALVATSSMELGIDVGSVELVVQFMSPRQVIASSQRIGRAGHRAGETSRGVIVTPGNVYEALESGVIAFRTERGHLEDIRMPRKSYDALAHQSVAMVVEGLARTVDEIYEIASSTQPYRDISREEVGEVVGLLASLKILRDRGGRLAESGRTRSYLYRVTMIPDERYLDVIDIVSGSKIGEVSENLHFINSLKAEATGGRPRMVLMGRAWEVVEVDLERGKVMVKPVGVVEAAVPVWEGELIPVSSRVAREVCSLLELAMEDPEAAARVISARKLPPSVVSRIIDVAVSTREKWGGRVISVSSAVVEVNRHATIVYACLGSRGNFALALLLSKLIEGAVRVEMSYIPYAVVFRSPIGVVPGHVVAAALEKAKSLDPAERMALVQDAVRSSRAYLLRFVEVARRMGLIDPDAPLNPSLAKKLLEASMGGPVEREAMREVIHDKLDMEAVNDYLDGLRGVDVVVVDEGSPLAREVLENPYIKKDVAVNVKGLAIEVLIEAKKRHLASKTVIMACILCGAHRRVHVGSVERVMRCHRCGRISLAPLPDSDLGRRMLEALRASLSGSKLSRDESKLLEEVRDRAALYTAYAAQGMARKIVEALASRGVGPRRARRVMDAYVSFGEARFYEEIMKAEEEYLANRKYWREQKYSL